MHAEPAATNDAQPAPPWADMAVAGRLRAAAWGALLLAAIAVPLLLVMIRLMPIGPMYWDVEVYLDAAYRIGLGQMPAVDFFAPAGPLDYYLHAALEALFPNGQPVLLASWSILLVTLPLMALVTADVARHSPGVALTLAVPFVFYSLIPFNTSVYYPFPGADGFGIYNRHGSQLLYVLVSALLFMRGARMKAVAVVLAMTALFAIKITAFAAGGLLCALALACGRVSVRTAWISALGAAALAAVAEAATGIVSSYVADLGTLAGMNGGRGGERLVQSFSRMAGIALSLLVLAGVLFFAGRARRSEDQAGGVRRRLDHPAVWLVVTVGAGVFHESQNTGSQEYIFAIPVVLYAALSSGAAMRARKTASVAAFLAACALLPPLVTTGQSAARAIGASLRQVPLAHENLGPYGAVLVRPAMQNRAAVMRRFYEEQSEAVAYLAEQDQLHSFLLFSDFDFQIGRLEDIDAALRALKSWQADGVAFDSVMTLDFTDPFPRLTGRRAPAHISIGAVPHRTVPPLTERARAAVADTDIILEPRCPFTQTVLQLRDHYAAALTEHRVRRLTPCYWAWVHPRLHDAVPSRITR